MDAKTRPNPYSFLDVQLDDDRIALGLRIKRGRTLQMQNGEWRMQNAELRRIQRQIQIRPRPCECRVQSAEWGMQREGD